MQYIKCDNSTPITISSGVFDGVSKTIPLYVPVGSKAAYQAAQGWKDFTNIIEVNNDITVSSNTVDLTGTSTAKVTVSTTGSWTATCDQTWLTITPTSGDGNGEITITAEPNTTGATRTATITIVPKLKSDANASTITVIQSAADVSIIDENGKITVSSDTIFASNIQTAKIALVLPYKWEVSSDQTWATVSPASGEGNAEVIITLEQNFTQVSRTAMVTVYPLYNQKSDQGPFTIFVIQAAQNTALAGEGNSETSIYPNPTHSHITIGAPAAEGQVVSLIAPNGAVLAQTSVSGGTAQFSVVGLPKGIYTVQLQSNVKAIWQRVVVE